MKKIALALSLVLVAGVASADSVTGFNDVAIDNSDPNNVFLSSLTWGGTTYAGGSLVFGSTSRWYIPDTGIETLWVEGDDAQAGMPTVSGTSSPKPGDVGSHADNLLWRAPNDTGGSTPDISSIDGIEFQETIFSTLVDTIFVFERGGNDSGTIQPILADDSLGTQLSITGGGDPYLLIGNYSGQNDHGYVLETDVPVKGIRITASGHDSLTIATIPEPTTLPLLGLAGLFLIARRRSG
jgi:hypothetical protein